MPKSTSKASKRPCKGTLYTINGNKWCVAEKKSKKSRRHVAIVLRKSKKTKKSKKSKKSQKSRRRLT